MCVVRCVAVFGCGVLAFRLSVWGLAWLISPLALFVYVCVSGRSVSELSVPNVVFVCLTMMCAYVRFGVILLRVVQHVVCSLFYNVL